MTTREAEGYARSTVGVHAIVHAVPEGALALRGEARVRDLSRRARLAASESARVSALQIPGFRRDREARPLASRGVHWGVSHVATMVAGIVARAPIAIDVERVRFRSVDQIRAALSEEEHDLLGGELLHAYFRAWTAKEAVLKLAGVGLSHLSQVTVAAAPSSTRTRVRYGSESFDVDHTWPVGHIVAVAGHEGDVHWHFSTPAGPPSELSKT